MTNKNLLPLIRSHIHFNWQVLLAVAFALQLILQDKSTAKMSEKNVLHGWPHPSFHAQTIVQRRGQFNRKFDKFFRKTSTPGGGGRNKNT